MQSHPQLRLRLGLGSRRHLVSVGSGMLQTQTESKGVTSILHLRPWRSLHLLRTTLQTQNLAAKAPTKNLAHKKALSCLQDVLRAKLSCQRPSCQFDPSRMLKWRVGKALWPQHSMRLNQHRSSIWRKMWLPFLKQSISKHHTTLWMVSSIRNFRARNTGSRCGCHSSWKCWSRGSCRNRIISWTQRSKAENMCPSVPIYRIYPYSWFQRLDKGCNWKMKKNFASPTWSTCHIWRSWSKGLFHVISRQCTEMFCYILPSSHFRFHLSTPSAKTENAVEIVFSIRKAGPS